MDREKAAENNVKKPIEWKAWQERFKFLISPGVYYKLGGVLILIAIIIVVGITFVTAFSMSKAEREMYNPENIPIPLLVPILGLLGISLIFVGAVLSGIRIIGYYIRKRK